MDSVVTRAATPDDRSGIESIGDVYNGIDYVEAYYSWMLQSPSCLPFVATVNGQVAAFCNFYIIEGGHSALSVAARVAKQYRGMGIATTLKSFMYSELHRLYPNLTTEVYTADVVDSIMNHIEKNSDTMQITKRWHLYDVICERKVLFSAVEKMKNKEKTPQMVVSLTLSDVMRRADEVLPILGKDSSTFVYDNFWVALRVNRDNLRQASMHSDVMATCTSNNQLKSLSFTSIFKNGTGMVTNIFYYGDSVEDCLEHLIRVLIRIAGICPMEKTDQVAVVCHFPSQLSWADISRFFRKYLGPPLSSFFDHIVVENKYVQNLN